MTRMSEIPPELLNEMTAAVVTLLSSFGRLSQRIIATLLQDLFLLQISDDQISRLQSIRRKAMQARYDEIVVDEQALRKSVIFQ